MIVRIARAKVGHRQAPQMKKPIPIRGGLFYLDDLCGDLLESVTTRLPDSSQRDAALPERPPSPTRTRRVSVQANLGPAPG